MAFGGGLDDDDSPMSEINMTPLVDVMLVLLIIFMITVPVLTHSVKVDLPRSDNEPAEMKPETITLAVDAEGQVYWNETTIEPEVLERRLADEARKDPQPEIHIRGDRTADYEHVIRVMAASQRAGIQKLGFVTEPQP